MFGVPGPTEFDVRFRLLGIPVRIHPLFWAVSAILGWSAGTDGQTLVIWIACVFFSILVHEFGHALTARAFGAEPDVLLYSLGGLCIYHNPREGLWRRFLVLIMGPGAGFLLLAAVVGLVCVWLRVSPIDVWEGQLWSVSRHGRYAIRFLVWINLFWGLFNLLPIMPLDGGQIAMVFLTMHNRHQGRRRAYIVSLVTAGLLALYFVRSEQWYNALLVGMLALASFQTLQVLHHQSRFGSMTEDDADWWKR